MLHYWLCQMQPLSLMTFLQILQSVSDAAKGKISQVETAIIVRETGGLATFPGLSKEERKAWGLVQVHVQNIIVQQDENLYSLDIWGLNGCSVAISRGRKVPEASRINCTCSWGKG